MAISHRQIIKERRVLLGGAGLIMALALGLGLDALGLAAISLRNWFAALVITVVLQALLWAVLRLGWDRHLTWDPHYLYVPMAVAVACLNLYMYLDPSLRMVLLMAWFSFPVFMAGLAGAAGVVTMAGLVGLGYLGAVALLSARGSPVSWPFEVVVVGIFMIVNGYTAVVFERLRRERIERRRLRETLSQMAITDPLTGIFNRRHFDGMLRNEIERVRRYGGHCSLALIDLDFFKVYNDTLGHVAGDALLRELASVIKSYLRTSDVCARYGGEEFGLILVHTPCDDAAQAMERLRDVIEQYPFHGGKDPAPLRLTVSVGVACCPEDASEPEDLVTRADDALYAAKRLGRNRVQVAALA